MKALILAGGAGTRLRPITYTSSKQLVPVANKPILFYAIEQIAAAGITEVGMIVGDTVDEIKAAVGTGEQWGISVTYIQQEAPLGLAHAVLIAEEFLGDEEFIMYLGDNLVRSGVAEFIEMFSRERKDVPDELKPSAQILIAKVPDPTRFGVVALDDQNHVIGLVEKPKNPPSDFALVGIYMFDKTIHQAVRALKPSARGELEITEAIQWLIDNNFKVRSEMVDGYWKDLGELDAFLEGNRLLLEAIETRIDGFVDSDSRIDGRVIVEEGAEIFSSTVRGPAIIGKGTKLRNAYVGPFSSIGDNCEIIDAEIEHSVVMESSQLVNVGRVEDSLIGREVKFIRTDRRPRASRLMVGDHSALDISWG